MGIAQKLVFCVLLGACAPAPSKLNWAHDIKPLIVEHCGECHGKSKLSVDLPNIPQLAGIMVQEVEAGRMPPWVPRLDSREMLGRREFPVAALATLKKWLQDPIIEGEEVAAVPRPKVDFGREPDAVLQLPGNGYVSASARSDELRCFLLPQIPGHMFVYGYEWVISRPSVAHHVVVGVLGAADVARARALDDADPALGWDCNAATLPFKGSLINTTVGPDSAYEYPKGAGVEVPAGGALVLEVHALPLALRTPAQFGVKLWLRNDAHAVTATSFNVPSEVPCPSGVSSDPSNRCSREWALSQAVDVDARSNNDRILVDCEQNLTSRFASVIYDASSPTSWLVASQCVRKFPGVCSIFSIHPHLHVRAREVRIEACPVVGTCELLYATDNWRWLWESSYTYATPLHVDATWTFRMSATWDNGTLAQPNAQTGEPGHDGPALPPLALPSYHITDTARDAEMFSVTFECLPN